jgi:hypothetical protein
LEHAADTAEDTAREQERAAGYARAASRARRNGESWREVARTGQLHSATTLLTRCAQRLLRTTGELRRSWARALISEGFSLRQVASHFGVSHQRVSALLANGDRAARRGSDE